MRLIESNIIEKILVPIVHFGIFEIYYKVWKHEKGEDLIKAYFNRESIVVDVVINLIHAVVTDVDYNDADNDHV